MALYKMNLRVATGTFRYISQNNNNTLKGKQKKKHDEKEKEKKEKRKEDIVEFTLLLHH